MFKKTENTEIKRNCLHRTRTDDERPHLRESSGVAGQGNFNLNWAKSLLFERKEARYSRNMKSFDSRSSDELPQQFLKMWTEIRSANLMPSLLR